MDRLIHAGTSGVDKAISVLERYSACSNDVRSKLSYECED